MNISTIKISLVAALLLLSSMAHAQAVEVAPVFPVNLVSSGVSLVVDDLLPVANGLADAGGAQGLVGQLGVFNFVDLFQQGTDILEGSLNPQVDMLLAPINDANQSLGLLSLIRDPAGQFIGQLNGGFLAFGEGVGALDGLAEFDVLLTQLSPVLLLLTL